MSRDGPTSGRNHRKSDVAVGVFAVYVPGALTCKVFRVYSLEADMEKASSLDTWQLQKGAHKHFAP